MRDAVSIVVPTFREAANVRTLVHRVDAALSRKNIDWELILVDDDSNDGVETIVAEMARHLPVRVETRRGAPRDLSLSVLLGMRLARFDRLVVMDADLSHPPEQIIDLLGALDVDCDMAVGSRYASGASVDQGWAWHRRLISKIGTGLARPLANCGDPLSGFFATDRRRLPDLAELRPLGYKIALELMVRWRLRVRDVPIRFGDRSRGESKMSWRTHRDFLRHLCRLYAHRIREMVRGPCRDDRAA